MPEIKYLIILTEKVTKNIQLTIAGAKNTMIVIVCIDDNLGMMFNNRRLSKDIVLTEKVVDVAKNSKLWLNKYSYSLFEQFDTSNINVDETFLAEAANGEYCFVENKELKPFEKWIEKMIVFRWNKSYPADQTFDIDLSKWQLSEVSEFEGNSHEKITVEVYVK